MAISLSSAAMMRSASPISLSIRGSSFIARPIRCNLLMLKQFGLHMGGDAEATALHDVLGELIDHQGAKHFLALAAAGDAVALDAVEHAAQELGDENGLILRGRGFGLGGKGCRAYLIAALALANA